MKRPQMPTKVTINYIPHAGWDAAPPKAKTGSSKTLIFNVADIPKGKTGVRLCFTNPHVFGVPFLEFLSKGDHPVPVVGPDGETTKYHGQDAGTECVPQDILAEPFDVTIGSTLGEGKY